MGKRIEVKTTSGHFVEYLDLHEQKERYQRFFKDGYPSDGGLIEFLNFKAPKLIHSLSPQEWSPEQQAFLNLLNFSELQTQQQVRDRLLLIGKDLFYNFQLKVFDHNFHITSFELFISGHPHLQDVEQNFTKEHLSRGHFSVSKTNQLDSPKKAELQITCGDHQKQIFAFLKIREIDKLGGPNKALIQIIDGSYSDSRDHNWNEKELIVLEALNDSHIFSPPIFLEPHCNSSKERPIFCGSRVLTESPSDHSANVYSWRVATWSTTEHPQKMVSVQEA